MGFFSRFFGNPPKPVPSANAEPERYKGRPLLIVMENYVLDCIGELAADKQDGIRKIVQKVWQGGDDWKKTVRAQLHLEDSIDDVIRGLWEKNQKIANESNAVLHPVEFAKMVVDENFSQLF
jgi:hypothetical protein